VISPDRNIPRAVIWSVGIASLLHIAVCAVALGATSAEKMARTAALSEEITAPLVVSAVVTLGGVALALRRR